MSKSYKRDMQKFRQKEREKKAKENEAKIVMGLYYGKKKDDSSPKTWLELPCQKRRSANTDQNVLDSKKIGVTGYCIKCGIPEYKDGYCWECYKEQKNQ